ncbi:MAG: purine-nucleoside phosphorylase [Bacteroidota bacterium]
MAFHIGAKKGEIANTVLLPGDPLRARFVSENLMQDSFCYNEVRGMYGYTGFYNGKRVSIQGAGMGIPSNTIYAHELINTYGVRTLIRVGTCGAVLPELKLGQVILAITASSDSGINNQIFKGLNYAPAADFALLSAANDVAKKLGIDAMIGNVFSTDVFYSNEEDRWGVWAQHGILAAEMETSGLYTIAARFNVKALSILTVSDNIITGEVSSAKDREQRVSDMMKIALEIADE